LVELNDTKEFAMYSMIKVLKSFVSKILREISSFSSTSSSMELLLILMNRLSWAWFKWLIKLDVDLVSCFTRLLHKLPSSLRTLHSHVLPSIKTNFFLQGLILMWLSSLLWQYIRIKDGYDKNKNEYIKKMIGWIIFLYKISFFISFLQICKFLPFVDY